MRYASPPSAIITVRRQRSGPFSYSGNVSTGETVLSVSSAVVKRHLCGAGRGAVAFQSGHCPTTDSNRGRFSRATFVLDSAAARFPLPAPRHCPGEFHSTRQGHYYESRSDRHQGFPECRRHRQISKPRTHASVLRNEIGKVLARAKLLRGSFRTISDLPGPLRFVAVQRELRASDLIATSSFHSVVLTRFGSSQPE